MAPDLDGLLQRFTAWGAGPTVDGYVELFAPDGTLFDSGMDQPLGRDHIRPLITATLQLLDGFRFVPIRHGRNEDTLYVEAQNSATLGGTALAWPAVYCLTAAGDRVARGRRYYDQAPLFPAVGDTPTEDLTGCGPLSIEVVTSGSGEGVWFREWVGTAAPTGEPQRFAAMERHSSGATTWFYNSLALLPRAAAQFAAFQRVLIQPT